MKKYILGIIVLGIVTMTNAQNKMKPNLEKAHLQIGLQDFKGAILTYTHIIKTDSASQQALVGRAEAKLLLNDYFGAIQDLSTALKYQPSSIAYFTRGQAKNKLLDYRGAIIDFNKAHELDPQNETIILERGKSQLALKSYEESIVDFTKLIELNPSNKDAFYLRGLIKIYQGKKEEGCLDLSHAGELGDEEAYKKIAVLCVP